jgi:hypothetical protein
LRVVRYDDVRLEPDQLGREGGQPVEPTLRKSIVDDNILALSLPELAQPFPERIEVRRRIGKGPRPKKTYPRQLPRLLPLSGERRKSEAERENDREPDQTHGHLV